MKLSKCIYVLLYILPFSCVAQTVILDDPGFTFTAVSGPDPIYEWDSPDIDISLCTSIEISFEYAWSTDWSGSGNLETPDECGSCAGDPEDPAAGDCANCWDMLYTQVFLDGSEEDNNLLGDVGYDQQFGSVTMGPYCTEGAEVLNLEFDGTVYSVSPLEEIEVSEVMVICWQAHPMIEDQEPVCNGGDFELIGDAGDTDDVVSWFWQTDGPSMIDNDAVQTTFASGVEDGEVFTLTTTDANNCQATETIEAMVNSYDVELEGGGIICETGCTDAGSDLLFNLSGGTPLYQVSMTVNGIPLPFVPAIDLNGTFRICSDPDVFLPEYDDNTDPPQLIIPSSFFPIEIEITNIVDDENCIGNIIGGSIEYDFQFAPVIGDAESPAYCVAEDNAVDLTLMEPELNPDGYDLFWFEDEMLEDPISDPSQYDTGNGNTVWAVIDDGDCVSLPVEIVLDLNLQPIIDIIESPIGGCASNEYFLPPIDEVADIENAINPGYYLDPLGEEGPVTVINPQDVDEVYIVDGISDECFDAAVIPVIIQPQPDIESPLDELVGCGELVLPQPEGSDFDFVQYNTQEDGTGDSYTVGEVINSSDGLETLYLIVSNTSGCELIIELDVTLGSSVMYSSNLAPIACDSVVLPPIMPASATVSYYTGSMGTGMQLDAGDVIYAPFDGMLYIFDTALGDDCAEEDTLDLQLVEAPMPNLPSDTSACDFLVLPDFGGVTGPNARYARFPIGNPNSSLYPGDTIDFGERLYILDTIGSCIYFDSIDITIVREPNAGIDTSLIICTGFQTLNFNLMQLVSNPDTDGEWNYPQVPDFNPVDSTQTDLSVLPPGNYSFRYTIEDSLCGLFGSEFSLEVIDNPYSGQNNSLNLCAASEILDFMMLIDSPDQGGNWMQVSGPQNIDLSDTTNVDMSMAPTGSYAFLYVIEGQANSEYCEAGSSSLFISIGSGGNAGADMSATACQGDVLELTDYLSAGADMNGIFEGDNLIFSGTTWNTLMAEANQDYVINYIVESNEAGCPDDTSSIVITLVEQLYAGDDPGAQFTCASEIINLEDLILNASDIGEFQLNDGSGTVVSGGLWTADGTTEFLHIIEGTGTCPSDTLAFEIEVGQIPQYNVVFQGAEICIDNLNTSIPFEIIHQNTVANDYIINIYDTPGNLIFSLDSLIAQNLQLNIVASGNGPEVNLDTLFLPGLAGSYVFEILATDSTGLCTEPLGSDVTVNVVSPYTEDIDVSLCPGDSYVYNGVEYTSSETLTFSSGIIGCDSTININISNYPQEAGMVSGQYCEGDTVFILGESYTNNFTGTELFENASSFGCDSLVDVDIEFVAGLETIIDDMICADETIDVNGISYDINNPAGTDTLQSITGCDSVLIIDIQFMDLPESDLMTSICRGDQLSVGSDVYDANNPSGTSILENASSNGCDSIVNVSLEILEVQSALLDQAICPDESVMVGGDEYNAMNLQGATLLTGGASNGCDSLVEVNLVLLENPVLDLEAEICESEVIVIGSDSYSIDMLGGTTLLPDAAINGCDSIVNVALSVILPDAELSAGSICPGQNSTTLEIQSVFDLDFPLQLIVNGTTEGPINTLPYEVTVSGGMNDIELIGNNGCQYNESILVDGLQNAVLEIDVNPLVDNSFNLGFTTDFVYSTLQWSNDSNVDIEPLPGDQAEITIVENTTVELVLEDENGCMLSQMVTLNYTTPQDIINVYQPNIIDINNPENNNFRIFTSEGAEVSELSVFDRWGNPMYISASAAASEDIGWDGRRNDQPVEQGVYVYRAQIRYSDGTKETITGSLTVIK